MRKAYVSLVSVVAGALWLGCFNVASLSTGERPDGGVPEDGGASTPPAEGGSSTDSQASADTSSSTLGFCNSLSTTPTFCDDFDEADSGSFSNWDQVIELAHGSVTRDPTLSLSPPYSMLAQSSALLTGETSEADILKQFQEFEQKGILISISFAMNVTQWDTSTSGQIIAAEVIFKNSTNQFNQIVLNLNSLGSSGVSGQIAENAEQMDGGTPYNNYPLEQHPVTNAWTNVEMDLSIPAPTGSSSNTVTVKLDGQNVLDAQPLGIPIQGGIPWLHLGIGYVAASTTGWAVNYDNLVVTITPI